MLILFAALTNYLSLNANTALEIRSLKWVSAKIKVSAELVRSGDSGENLLDYFSF